MPPKKIPFDFILDYLISPGITIKPLFGMFYIYSGSRIVFILRKRLNEPHLNGIWVAVDTLHQSSLCKELPSLHLFAWGKEDNESGWLLLQTDAKDFETSAIQLCRLVDHGDKRIGRLVNKRK